MTACVISGLFSCAPMMQLQYPWPRRYCFILYSQDEQLLRSSLSLGSELPICVFMFVECLLFCFSSLWSRTRASQRLAGICRRRLEHTVTIKRWAAERFSNPRALIPCKESRAEACVIGVRVCERKRERGSNTYEHEDKWGMSDSIKKCHQIQKYPQWSIYTTHVQRCTCVGTTQVLMCKSYIECTKEWRIYTISLKYMGLFKAYGQHINQIRSQLHVLTNQIKLVELDISTKPHTVAV